MSKVIISPEARAKWTTPKRRINVVESLFPPPGRNSITKYKFEESWKEKNILTTQSQSASDSMSRSARTCAIWQDRQGSYSSWTHPAGSCQDFSHLFFLEHIDFAQNFQSANVSCVLLLSKTNLKGNGQEWHSRWFKRRQYLSECSSSDNFQRFEITNSNSSSLQSQELGGGKMPPGTTRLRGSGKNPPRPTRVQSAATRAWNAGWTPNCTIWYSISSATRWYSFCLEMLLFLK